LRKKRGSRLPNIDLEQCSLQVVTRGVKSTPLKIPNSFDAIFFITELSSLENCLLYEKNAPSACMAAMCFVCRFLSNSTDKR
jgi:hypothetical protein